MAKRKKKLSITIGTYDSQHMDRDYTYDEVKWILRKNKLSLKEFNKWMYGQTGPILVRDGKHVFGVFGWDLGAWIDWQLGGKAPLWD